ADPINGGPPAVGETRQAALNLTITGSGVIDLLELGVDGANASDFSAQIQNAAVGAPLPGRASYPITVTYTPSDATPQPGEFYRLAEVFVRLRIEGRIKRVAARLVSYVAEGELQVLEGGAPVSELLFGNVIIPGEAVARPLALRNRRPVDNVVSVVAIEGADADLFELWNTPQNNAFAVPANGILLTGNGGLFNFGLKFHQPPGGARDIDAELVVQAFTGELRVPLRMDTSPITNWVIAIFDFQPPLTLAVEPGG
ncbi:MAG: hypothetical protein KDJ16_03365, partial [Hyphomicrobiales bacterium]|nr:hypothetical protein [Hyphomicrobiales bacterium]